MSDAPNPPTQDEEPAEGGRDTVEQAEREASAARHRGISELDALRSLSFRYDLEQLAFLAGGLTFIDAAGLGALLALLRRFGGEDPLGVMDLETHRMPLAVKVVFAP